MVNNKNASAVLTVDEKNLAFGLDWMALSGISAENSEIISLAKEGKYKLLSKSISPEGGDNLVGFYNGTPKAKGKIFSGALAFCRMPDIKEVSLLVSKTDDGNVVVCAIKQGKPVVGYDFYGDYRAGVSLARDFLTMSSDAVSVYGNDSEFDNASDITLETISEFIEKEDELIKVSSLSSISLKSLIIIVSMIAVAYGGWDFYSKEQEKIKRRASKKENPEVAYRKNLEKEIKNVSGQAVDQWNQIASSIGAIPLKVNGWYPNIVECAIQEALNCKIVWKTETGTFKGFKEGWETEPSNITYNYKAYAVEQTFNVPMSKLDIDFKALPKSSEIFFEVGSKAQLAANLKLNVSMSDPKPFAVPNSIKNKNKFKSDDLVQVGLWEINGDYWMTDFLNHLDSNFTIKSFRIDHAKENLKIKVKGEYYVDEK